jgi:hypothetical protein
MHQEFDALRAAARSDPSPEASKRRLAEIDELEQLSKEVETGIAALKNDVETNGRPKTFLGFRIGTPLEWVLVIGLPAIVLTIASVLDLTRNETGAVMAMLVLSIGAACLIAAVRLKAMVQARRKEQSLHLATVSKPTNRL